MKHFMSLGLLGLCAAMIAMPSFSIDEEPQSGGDGGLGEQPQSDPAPDSSDDDAADGAGEGANEAAEESAGDDEGQADEDSEGSE